METEINSQGEIIENLLRKYIVNYCVLADIPLSFKNVVIVASGSSYNAGLYGKYFFENISNTKTSVEYSSEFINNNLTDFSKDNLYIFISQSGNSTDTVKALEKVKKTGCKVLCIVNNEDSQMYKLADYRFNINAKTEQAIAATKTFSATVVMLWILAIKAAQNKKIDVSNETQNVSSIENIFKHIVENIENLDYTAKFLSKQKNISICAFGQNYPIAKELALKIKETSYINTCAYPTGEFIHGHYAVLNNSKALVAFINFDANEAEVDLLDKIISTYKPKLVVISDDWKEYRSEVLIKFPKQQSKIVTTIAMIVVAQLLAFKIARILKRDVDFPKGLNKVVI